MTQDAERMLQLARLRTRIDEGRYAVDPHVVADAILRRLGATRRDAPALDVLEPLPAQATHAADALSRPGARSRRARGRGRRAG